VPPEYQGLFGQLAAASEDNTVTLPLEVFQQGFMGDAAPESAAVVRSVLRGQPYRTFTDEPVNGDQYRALGIPQEYVLSSEDVRCRRGTSPGRPVSRTGATRRRAACPAATGRCSPARPSWPTGCSGPAAEADGSGGMRRLQAGGRSGHHPRTTT
jgi:hypothetical protein